MQSALGMESSTLPYAPRRAENGEFPSKKAEITVKKLELTKESEPRVERLKAPAFKKGFTDLIELSISIENKTFPPERFCFGVSVPPLIEVPPLVCGLPASAVPCEQECPYPPALSGGLICYSSRLNQ